MSYPHHLYTVESVTSGHPDKICDQVSDAILDACLTEDSMSRVAIETFGAHGLFVIGGEITTTARPDYGAIAQKVYASIGYNDTLRIVTDVVAQSPDIAMGVDTGGAGDQGIMYGFATDETPEFLPKGIVFVHALTQGLEKLRTEGTVSWLGPDGKAQVTVTEGKVSTVLISTQHHEDISQEEIVSTLRGKLIEPIIGDLSDIEVLINPTGAFVRGGFEADTGLTGRKIMVDTYGGLAPHGGGAFSGKDATKVDRSAAYMARFVAIQAVAQKLAKKCSVAVAYAIGRAEPVMVTAHNEKGEDVYGKLKNTYDFRPAEIIKKLDLRKPIFQKTASYGHFGHKAFSWEQVEVVQ